MGRPLGQLGGRPEWSRQLGWRQLSLVVLASLGFALARPGSAPGATSGGTISTSCAPPSSQGAAKNIMIADPACEYDYITNSYTGSFGPSLGASGKVLSRTYVGISDQAAYRIEVPESWNGALVLYAHPYHGIGDVVWAAEPQLRSWFVSQGFAWAASSFSANGFDVGQGVTNTHDLLGLFTARTKLWPSAVYLEGESMGGEVATVLAQDYPGAFGGLMTTCATLSPASLADYYLGVNATAAALTHTPINFPNQASIASALGYEATVETRVLPGLGAGFLAPGGPARRELTPAGRQWEAVLSYLSGGPRPGFDGAFAYWNSVHYGPLRGMPTLFDLYPGLVGGAVEGAPRNVTTNAGVVYRLPPSPGQAAAQAALNAEVLRVSAPSPDASVPGEPGALGDPHIPVMALYGVGDLLVPLSTGQEYAAAMSAHGESGLFVARAIREVTHCGYSNAELSRGFADLVSWVRTGHRPAGDDITNAAVVDSPTFGCRFTDGPHPLFHASACPK